MKAFPLDRRADAAPSRCSAFPMQAFPMQAFFTAAAPMQGVPDAGLPHEGVPARHGAAVRPRAADRRRMGAVLQGTPLAGVPLQALTMSDVQYAPRPDLCRSAAAKRYDEIENIDFGDLQLDGTPLATLPTLAFLLWSLPLSAIPLAGSTGDSTAQWCAVYADFCAAATTAGTLGAATPATLVLAGESLENAGSRTPCSAPSSRSASLQSFPMKAFPMQGVRHAEFADEGVPDARPSRCKAFDRSGGDLRLHQVVDCVNGTLGDVTAADAWAVVRHARRRSGLSRSSPATRRCSRPSTRTACTTCSSP